MERAGDFPQHFMLTPRCAAWDEADIDAWLAKRKAKPVQGTPAPNPRGTLSHSPRRVRV
ncbi:MAG: AlpA family phage regulatory protein [Thiobacillus sp.]|uniref:helix-turn-helix transcriptional regulator n=1 Tax=Thiobacillus sp. TaxID=924 RepID=UPI00168C3976|nr:MAG: AlpA family phage regulatory protein [Thiobacillus sp.]